MTLALFVGRRLLLLCVTLVLVSVITFFTTRVLPGNPAYLIVGQHADAATVQAVTEDLGLDRSIPEQYALYVEQLASGDLGTSYRSGNPVNTDLGARWPATIELGTFAMLAAVAWAVLLGVAAALRPRSLVDRLASALSGAGVSVPDFWLGILLVLVFFNYLGVAPAPLGRIVDVPAPEHVTGFYTVDSLLTGDWAALRASLAQLVLPVATLSFVIGAPLLRVTRTFMRKELASDYVRSARALGVPRRRVIARHALPNVLLPLTTMIALLYGYLLGGTVLVEVVFAWPGVGKYAVDSVAASDYAPVMAVVLLSAVSYLVVYLVTDVLHVAIDPRTRS
jgi:ABC-type dipeptide/oligopeptide/nickel transport system permease component